MKRVILFVLISLLLSRCDDGDFDVPSFVFENNIDDCGDSSQLIVFNIGANDSEALILNINKSNSNHDYFKTERTDTITLSDKIYYRVFNDVVTSSYFCNNIPPPTPSIANEWIGSGTVIIKNEIVNDDHDSVEELDHDLDSDGDGIKNYLDKDDDNDGILTIDEINLDVDGNFESFIDTDGDSIPNYLDNDDDNDGVLTINEFDNGTATTIADYLDATITDVQTARILNPNKYILTHTTTFRIEDMSLVNDSGNAINYTNYQYGVFIRDFTIE